MKKSTNKTILLLLFITGCAAVPSYKTVEGMLARNEFDKAVANIESHRKAYSSRSELVYQMDSLMTTHLAGSYGASAAWAEKAHRRIEELFTISLSGEGMTWLLNDSGQDYRGEHFEQIMVNLFGLLNYAAQGDPQEALVEARRADLRFKERERRFGASGRYGEDGLMRWLSAVMYEAQGDRHDAYLDYRKAIQAYKNYPASFGMTVPRAVILDAMRLAEELREVEALKEFKESYPDVEPPKTGKGLADIVVLIYDGLIGSKVSRNWDVPVAGAGYAQYFSVAYPSFEKGAAVIKEASVRVDEGPPRPVELFENLSAIAAADLEDRMLGIKVKAIARATAKFQAGKAIQKNQDTEGKKLLAAIVTNVFSVATEQADIRSWRTLPGRIHVLRVRVKPGLTDLKVTLSRLDGKQETREFTGLSAQIGKPVMVIAPAY